MKKISTGNDLDKALISHSFILFMHSTRCLLSGITYKAMKAFIRENKAVPVFLIDVIQNRELSQCIISRFAVSHQSPQVILIKNGKVVWNASHFRISKKNLEAHLKR
jgi:bacillithiol system protein YtxJ